MKNILLLLLTTIVLMGCQNKSTNNSTEDSGDLPQNDKIDLAQFYEFYNLFHADTAFQIAHITFPLEGKPSEDMEYAGTEKFYWQAENWIFHKAIDFETSQFKRKITPINDELVVEYIVHDKLGFGMIRRFAKLGDQWFLIYYEGMKPLVDAQ